MLSDLVMAAERFRGEGALAPRSTKRRRPNWVIEVDSSGQGYLLGPYRGKESHSEITAPDRQRSGKISESNLKPYLLMDDARYALGIAERGKETEAELAHRGFIQLLEEAYESTGDRDLKLIIEYLRKPLADDVRQKVQPKDIVTFRNSRGEFPAARASILDFWSNYLAKELSAGVQATCSVCGQYGEIVRILPNEVKIMGQKCQITSFNLPAFTSFGKQQTTNSPLCYNCATDAISALNYLTQNPKHHAVIARHTGSGQSHPLRNQLAVFWLRQPQQVESGGEELDLEELLKGPLLGMERTGTPPPDLAQLERLLRIPWTGEESATNLDTNSFHLAVLSANKGRLVVREWITVSLGALRDSLRAFLWATRIVGPRGEEARPCSIPAVVEAMESSDPNVTRGLLRTAYLGEMPPHALLEVALQRFRSVLLSGRAHNDRRYASESARIREQLATLHLLAAALKLSTTYGKEEGEKMEQLDRYATRPAYNCGRLLAVLEEIQLRAANWNINATLVDRFYGGASTAPAATLGPLVRLAETSHLPKIRRENRGYDRLKAELEEVMGRFSAAEGMPCTLTLTQQADFALGFYHQRAEFRRWRQERTQSNTGTTDNTSNS